MYFFFFKNFKTKIKNVDSSIGVLVFLRTKELKRIRIYFFVETSVDTSKKINFYKRIIDDIVLFVNKSVFTSVGVLFIQKKKKKKT